MEKRFVITTELDMLEDDEVELLVNKIISNSVDLVVYFQNQPVKSYVCRYLNEKAEIIYDIMYRPIYYSDDKKMIYIHNNLNNYGIYAIKNYLSDADMWKDREEF